MVDVNDIKIIDQDSVQVPGYMVGLLGAMPAMVVKVVDRASCTVRSQPARPEGSRYMEVYFGKFILDETRERRVESNQLFTLYKVDYAGEEPIYCMVDNGNKSCGRTFDSTVDEKNLPRVYNALKHLFAQHCPSAKRKGAF